VPRTPEELALESATVAATWGESSLVTSCRAAAADAPYVALGEAPPGAVDTPNLVMDARGLTVLAVAILNQTGLGPADDRILYRTRVTHVNTTDNVVTATGPNGALVRLQCRFMLDTLPLAARQAGAPPVTPALPLAAQATLQQLRAVQTRVVWLQYRTRIGPVGAMHWVVPPRDATLGVSAYTTLDMPGTPYAGSRLVRATLLDPQAAASANGDDATLVRRIAAELARVFGPAAAFANVSDWRVSPWTVDSSGQTNWPATVTPAAFRALWAPVQGHYFATGEAACPALYGTPTGAYLMGQTSARRALVARGMLSLAQVNPEDNACFWTPPARRR
jgi:monoamine oxidase